MQRMKHKKLLFLTMVLWILVALTFTNVPVQSYNPSTDVRIYVDMSPNGYVAGKVPGPPPGGLVFVNLYIDSPAAWDITDQGIVQWAISCKVDPDVLMPLGASGAGAGYFLYEFLVRSYYIYYGFSTSLIPPIADPAAGTLEWATEGILGPSPIPVGSGGSGKLVTLTFASKSETAYSPIDLFYEVDVDAWYWQAWDTAAENPIPVDVVFDGHYNLPPGGHTMDAMGFFPPPAPIGSDWHELEPNFSTEWSMESWEDNGDGLLSASDQVDMQHAGLPAPVWFHVEWVAPTIIPNDGIPDMLVMDKAVPEFPLGSVAPLALIAAVAYIWWVTRRKRQEAV